jgi:hypothetical protein
MRWRWCIASERSVLRFQLEHTRLKPREVGFALVP